MEFNLEQAIPILERTPAALRALLLGLPDDWVMNNEGGDSWSPYDVVGHLANLEIVDWIPRANTILQHGTSRPLDPVDRFAMFETSKGKSLAQLLDEFETLRRESLTKLRNLNLTDDDLARKGTHPALGEVTLAQLLATWVAHDLDHVNQISKTMARQYRETIGPWREYLLVMDAG